MGAAFHSPNFAARARKLREGIRRLALRDANASASETSVAGSSDDGMQFDLVGFAPLELPERDRANLDRFVAEGRHADMDWFARTLELRKRPADLAPGAKSALVLGAYYRDREHEAALEAGTAVRISRYAGGRDYHKTMKQKAKRLLDRIERELEPDGELHELAPDISLTARITTDSAPVPEKILARLAGLGWQGKHTNLIHPQLGSYFFLATILWNLELPPDEEQTDLCRECRLCIDACPTGALEELAEKSGKVYRIDAERCLSYQTIERADGIAPEYAERQAGWAFGCDICQEVCPYNRNRKARLLQTAETDFHLRPGMRELMQSGRIEDEAQWDELTRGSALRRARFPQLQRNLAGARRGSQDVSQES